MALSLWRTRNQAFYRDPVSPGREHAGYADPTVHGKIVPCHRAIVHPHHTLLGRACDSGVSYIELAVNPKGYSVPAVAVAVTVDGGNLVVYLSREEKS